MSLDTWLQRENFRIIKIHYFLLHSPVNSHVSSSNISRESTKESSFDTFEKSDSDAHRMSSPARSRWLEAFNRVCAELSEVKVSPHFILFCIAAKR